MPHTQAFNSGSRSSDSDSGSGSITRRRSGDPLSGTGTDDDDDDDAPDPEPDDSGSDSSTSSSSSSSDSGSDRTRTVTANQVDDLGASSDDTPDPEPDDSGTDVGSVTRRRSGDPLSGTESGDSVGSVTRTREGDPLSGAGTEPGEGEPINPPIRSPEDQFRTDDSLDPEPDDPRVVGGGGPKEKPNYVETEQRFSAGENAPRSQREQADFVGGRDQPLEDALPDVAVGNTRGRGRGLGRQARGGVPAPASSSEGQQGGDDSEDTIAGVPRTTALAVGGTAGLGALALAFGVI